MVVVVLVVCVVGMALLLQLHQLLAVQRLELQAEQGAASLAWPHAQGVAVVGCRNSGWAVGVGAGGVEVGCAVAWGEEPEVRPGGGEARAGGKGESGL